MNNRLEDYLDRIRKIWPGLALDKVHFNQDGLVNDVVVVNDEWVFRFGKVDYASKVLAEEIKLLQFARPHLSVEVPIPVKVFDDVIVYHYLQGQPLTRATIKAMGVEKQEILAHDLATFLRELHSIPIEKSSARPTLALVSREQWLGLRTRIERAVYPLLLPHQVAWCERLFDAALGDENFFTYVPTLIHGDLASYHILVNENGLSGIIDFGVGGIGDPASDLGFLLTQYGETFVSKLRNQYPLYDTVIQRARFYAQAIELQWVLLGIETGEKYWFTAHLGNARDYHE